MIGSASNGTTAAERCARNVTTHEASTSAKNGSFSATIHRQSPVRRSGQKSSRSSSAGSVTSIGFGAFQAAYLPNITFLGNAPALADANEFVDDGVLATVVYYYYGTTGWGSTYGGLPTVELAWTPQIVGGANVQTNRFYFTVIGTNGMTIIIEASTNLVNWQPIWTNTLSGTNVIFTDLQWTNYPNRYYRAR